VAMNEVSREERSTFGFTNPSRKIFQVRPIPISQLQRGKCNIMGIISDYYSPIPTKGTGKML
jgi:hypothetical protein